MIKNYILIGWRSLLKNRLFSFINIFGLALSMSLCMMVLLRIIDNFSYDTFHPAPEQTYRILSGIAMTNGNRINLATTPMPLKETLEQDSGFISEVVSLYPALRDDVSDGVMELPVNGAFTQPAFFRIFGFTLKHGNTNTALLQPNSIVLSEATARKFFGEVNPVGKLLVLKNLGAFQITGVMNASPEKSHIHYEAYASASSIVQLEKENRLPSKLDQWDTFENAYTYVRLRDNIPESVLSGKLEAIANTLNQESKNATISFSPQSISSITPGWTQLYHETSRGSSWGKLIAEVSIALIILISACFNYTNLSIARALTRGKEVGIRKLSGAARWQIFAQYTIEAVMISLFALCLAQVFLAFILEYKPFNAGYEMVPDIGLSFKVLIIFVAFAFFAGIMAGAMPAWILSAFKPINVLRGILTRNILGNLSLRKVLMVFQFSLSLIILVFLHAFYKQFEFMGSADGGFERKNIVVIPFNGNPDILKAELNRVSGVESIALTSDHFGKYVSGNVALYHDRDLKNANQLNYYYADAEFFNMMKLEIMAGENFTSVEQAERFIIINEKAAAYLGYQVPSAAVGEKFYLADSSEVEIRGVVKNFYHRSVGHNIESLVFRNRSAGFREVLLRVESSAQENIHERLESAWKKVYPDQPFSYTWLDKKIAELNDPSADISLLGFLALMTVSIASLGLLGLVVYTVETRKKEISIRKIVGASVTRIMVLLSKSYIVLLMISGIIALPGGYFLSELFLMNFANRIPLGVASLVSSFALLLLIGLITILSQTFKASTENPSKNLRSE
jgi:putative ABC transport system permease protein